MKKFKTKTAAMIICGVIDVALIFFYIVSLKIMQSSSDATKNVFDVISNILIVGISIVSTSLITVPLIQVRENNALCDKVLAEDVLSSSIIFDSIPEEKKHELLRALECNLYFGNNKVKESMYSSIRSKINDAVPSSPQKPHFIKQADTYFNLCDYDIECRLVDGFIEKRITKTLEVRSYKKQCVYQYQLISSTFSPEDDISHCRIESLHVNNYERNVKDDITEKTTNADSQFELISGYKKTITYFYNKLLRFSPDKSTKITICYITKVSIKDTISSFRLSYPCRKYRFKFKLDDSLAEKYNISINAFGFCDDGKNTPNAHRGSEVRVSFDDWIFPSNGVAIALIDK